jgi:hypothetical protein
VVDGESVWWGASGLQGPYPKRWHIRSFFKKSDGILAQKVATMAY